MEEHWRRPVDRPHKHIQNNRAKHQTALTTKQLPAKEQKPKSKTKIKTNRDDHTKLLHLIYRV
jgi:hypothetical protein